MNKSVESVLTCTHNRLTVLCLGLRGWAITSRNIYLLIPILSIHSFTKYRITDAELISTVSIIPGGPKKRPKLWVTLMARIHYRAKFPLAHLYYYLLINFSDVINECRRLYPDNDFVFMQDNASSHRIKATQNFLQDNMPDFISSQEWTPHSPDLNLLDYSVTDILQELVYEGRREPFANLKDLQTNGTMSMTKQSE